MVDRSLQGLEERLLRALRPTTPAAAVADNLSLPSPCQGTSQREHGARVTGEAAPHESPADGALATGVTSPLTVQQPPVPAKTKQRILRGEFIDFNSLLPEALYPVKHGASPSPSFSLRLSTDPSTEGEMVIAQQKPASRRAVHDLPSWMEAWNIYVSAIVAQHPACAASLLAYQRIICDASIRFPPSCWQRCDARFCASTAEDRSLNWDIKHNDLWLECFTQLPSPSPQTHGSSLGKPTTRRPVGVYTIFPTTASGTPFAPTGEPQLRLQLPKPPHPPLIAASHTSHQPQAHPTSQPLKTSAATLISTKHHAHAHYASSSIHAAGVETALTGRGPAPDPPHANLPINQHKPVTPIRPLELEREVVSFPDKGFVSQLLCNLTQGCDIGYTGAQFPHTACHLAAYMRPNVISDAIAKECKAGRMAGPYPHPPLPNLRCSGMGVVPQKDGCWRVIYHLSAPPGNSINDFIDPALHYCTIDAAIAILNTVGPGALMGKIDLKNAFRLIPVRKEDWHLLGVHWQDQWYVDKCLPFGLRSSPALFNQLASTIVWNYYNVHLIHYLDGFFTAGPPDSPICRHNMETMNRLCNLINAPTKPEKEEGPSSSLIFLGILLDSTTMQASITSERKSEILNGRRTCTKRELLSLIGKLAFASKVVPPGHIFLHRLIDQRWCLSTTTSHSMQRPERIFPGGSASSSLGQARVSSCNHIDPQPQTWTSTLMPPM